MTPNDTHYPFAAAALDAGLDVIGDKPVTHDFAQACDLVARTRDGQRVFAIAHGYSAYPMTRYARHLVREGALGRVCLVQVEYIQAGMATRVEDGPQSNRFRWILDPQRSGLALVMSAIGCHTQHLASHASGLDVAARRGRRRRAGAGTQGGRLRVGAGGVRRRRARHVHRHAGRGRRRERHPPAHLRRQGHARVVAPRSELPARRAAGRAGAGRTGAATRSCRRRSSRPDARRADIRKACAKRSRTSTPRRRRTGWHARSATRRWRCPIRASRKARTRWRSSRRAWRRRRRDGGSRWRSVPAA